MKTIDLEPDIELDEKEIREWLKMPESFALFRDVGDPPINDQLGRTWTLGPIILTRDSSIIEESNSAALRKLLESREDLKGQWIITPCSHSMCGWVDHLTFKVLEEAGTTKLTRMAKVYFAWAKALEGYPIADEDDVNKRTEEATLKDIENEGRSLVAAIDVKENWPQQVMDWLHEFDNDALSDHDGNGPCLTKAELLPAMYELGILDLHHKSEFLLMQLNALAIFMEWGAQTVQTLRHELEKMRPGSNPHIDAVVAALTQLGRLGLVRIIAADPKHMKRLTEKWNEGAYGDLWCRR